MMSPIPRGAGAALTVASALLIVSLTLTPTGSTTIHGGCVICGAVGGIDAVLNVAVFVPLGLGLALLGLRGITAIAIACAGSVTIELVQFFVVPGRSATLGDVLTNTTGAALGFWIAVNLRFLTAPSSRAARRLAALAGVAWVTTQVIAAFSILPWLPDPPHRAKVGRGLGATYQPFLGKVLDARIDDRQLRDQDLPRSRPFYHELVLREGSTMEVTAVPRGCTAQSAGLLHVGDVRYRDVGVVAARNRDVIFGMRTGAEALRLAPIRYRLADGLGPERVCDGVGDTLHISAQYSRSSVTLRVVRAGGTSRILGQRPQISQAWALFVPWPIYRDGGPAERFLNVTWVAALVLPIAFWAGIASAAGGRAYTATGAAFLAMLTFGFVFVPLAFGVPVASASDWVAALVTSALAATAGARTLAKA